jgi:transcriptional regulator with XRE-family HTH domain
MDQLRFTVRSPEDLGRAIRRVRADRGLSQADLAAEIAVDRSYVTKVENGRSSRLIRLIFDLLRVLDVEVTLTAGRRSRG